MFNLYIYLFLFIINVSFAQNIKSCSDFSLPGVYTLDKVMVNEREIHNILLVIITGAKKKRFSEIEHGTAMSYTIKGLIHDFEIKFKSCRDVILRNGSTVILTTDSEKEGEIFSISLLNSNIKDYDATLPMLDDDIFTDTEELEGGSMLDEYIDARSPSDSKEKSGDDTKLNSDSNEKKSVGKKRRKAYVGDRKKKPKPEKILIISDTTECSELEPGIYKINGLNNFYIEIIRSTQHTADKAHGVNGFLIYDDFFSVPVFNCKSVDKNFVFSLSRSISAYMILYSQFNASKPIDYKVPKNKLIYETYKDDKLSPSSNFGDGHFNVGCSILYNAYFKKKSTFTLKGNTTINITSVIPSLIKISKIFSYNIKGTITIDGKEYSFTNCERKYDNKDNNNNDSSILYKISERPKPKYYQFKFNILDILPPLISSTVWIIVINLIKILN